MNVIVSSDDRREARKAYARRLMRRLGPPSYVEVTHLPDPLANDVKELYRSARHQQKQPLIIVEHRPRDSPPQWICHTLLTSLQTQPLITSITGLLHYYHVQQRVTRKPPGKNTGPSGGTCIVDPLYTKVQRRARVLNRIPILIHTQPTTRQGTTVAPLTWHLRPATTTNGTHNYQDSEETQTRKNP